jgi:hypothetical protein
VALPIPLSGRIDEPRTVEEYADVLSRAATDRRAVVVRRSGADLAAIVPLEYLEMVEDELARREAERIAGQLDWDQLTATSPPSQEWFERDEPKPF